MRRIHSTQNNFATAPLVYPANKLGTFTQQAALVLWSSPLQEELEGGKEARDVIQCTTDKLKVWGTAVQFSYAVNSV